MKINSKKDWISVWRKEKVVGSLERKRQKLNRELSCPGSTVIKGNIIHVILEVW